MASERQTEGKAMKQKVMIGAVIVVVLIIIWQIKGMFGGSTPVPTPTSTQTKASPAANNANPKMTSPAGTVQPQMQQPVQQTQMKQMPVPSDSELLKMQQLTGEKFIGKLNELEELKIQRQIAETNQAITAAKLATVGAEKQMSELLTKSTVMVPAGDYAAGLAAPTTSGSTVVNVTPVQPVVPEVQYTVISVSMQRNQWTAVIGNAGKLYSVSVGDVLVPDGAVVTRINKTGVVLKKDGQTKKISIVTAI